MMNRGEEIRKEITAFKVEREKWQPFKQPAKANPGQTQQQLEPATSADTALLTGNGSGNNAVDGDPQQDMAESLLLPSSSSGIVPVEPERQMETAIAIEENQECFSRFCTNPTRKF